MSNGTIDTVSVVNDQGKPVAGELAGDHASWQSSEPLGYAKTYTATATAKDSAGRAVTQTSQFRTVKPANLTLPYLRANAGLLLSSAKLRGRPGHHRRLRRAGHGQGRRRADVEGHHRARGRGLLALVRKPGRALAPQAYWPAGAKVTVSANVYGVDLGGGLYGQQDVSTSFTIGQSKIAIADDKTYQINVYVDGQLVKTVPTAMGLHKTVTGDNGQKLDLRTRSGVHVIRPQRPEGPDHLQELGLSKGEQAYDEDVFWTTHISYAGEYIHAAPWSVGQQGNSDASHGCLNVNTATRSGSSTTSAPATWSTSATPASRSTRATASPTGTCRGTSGWPAAR